MPRVKSYRLWDLELGKSIYNKGSPRRHIYSNIWTTSLPRSRLAQLSASHLLPLFHRGALVCGTVTAARQPVEEV
jgi:hypothetical protein